MLLGRRDEERSRDHEVGGRRDLEVARVAGDDHDASARRLDERGVVGRLCARGVRGAERVGPERLRSLDGHELVARDRLDDVIAIDAFHGVGDREAGHGGVGTGAYRVDHGVEQGRRRQRAGGVVHDDDSGRRRDRVQSGAHRLRAGRSAGDGGDDRTAVPCDTGRENEHDVVACRGHGVNSQIDEARAGNGLELLGHTEAAPGAAGDDDAAGRATAVHAVRMAPGTRGRLYFPSAWSRRPSAASSFTLRAKVSSETRIWRALASIRFSPAERPLSFSRIDRFRTTSATW